MNLSNARKIQPLEFWSPDGIKVADYLVLYNFHGYNFDGTDAMVSFRIAELRENPAMHAQYWESRWEGSIAIPNDVVQTWGEDDEPIFDYVIAQLNLTKVEE